MSCRHPRYLSSEIDEIKNGDSNHHLIEIERPEESYIIIEVYRNDNEKRFIFLYCFEDKNQISLGKSTECDIIIKDQMISKIHAFITFHNENVFLRDNSSFYGTSILIKHDLQILFNKQLALQFKENLVTFELKYSNCMSYICSRLFKYLLHY